MNPDSLPDDEIDKLLDGPIEQSATQELRDALRFRTSAIVRRRRWLRYGVRAAALTVCFAGGMLVERFRLERSAPQPLVQSDPHSGDFERSQAGSLSPYERLRRDSDWALIQEFDIARAVRLYEKSLNVATDEERLLSPHDSWLLAALKADRLDRLEKQETSNADNHGT